MAPWRMGQMGKGSGGVWRSHSRRPARMAACGHSGRNPQMAQRWVK